MNALLSHGPCKKDQAPTSLRSPMGQQCRSAWAPPGSCAPRQGRLASIIPDGGEKTSWRVGEAEKIKFKCFQAVCNQAIEYAHKRPGNRSMNIDMYRGSEFVLFYIYAEDRPCTLAIASGDRRRHRKTGRGPGSCPPAPRGNH